MNINNDMGEKRYLYEQFLPLIKAIIRLVVPLRN